MNKCVLVVGPESSGSMLIAKACAHALKIAEFGQWNGVGWVGKDDHKLCHRSLPYDTPSQFPDIAQWLSDHEAYEVKFILVTRDITMSELSRFQRWGKPFEQSERESKRAQQIMKEIMKGDQPYFIWSYETFMFLGESYLKDLYAYLGVESDFMPSLVDGNRDKVAKIGKLEYATRRLKAQAAKYTKSRPPQVD